MSSRYAHEELEDWDGSASKRPVKRMSEKQMMDRIKYKQRRQAKEIESRNERDVVFPYPEDNGYYRP